MLAYFTDNSQFFKTVEHVSFVELFAIMSNGTEASVEFAKTHVEHILDQSFLSTLKQPLSYQYESLMQPSLFTGFKDVRLDFDMQHLIKKVPKV